MTPGASRPLASVALVLAIALSIATAMAPQVSAGTLPPPSVFRISPSRASPGAKVEIGGAGLHGAIAVMFGGEPASDFTVQSDSRVSALVPPGSGTVDVIVITRGGISAPTAADAFSYPGGPGRSASSVFAATPGVATSRRVTLTLTPGPLGVKTGATPGQDLRARLLGRWCPLTVRHGRPLVALACGLDAFSPASYIWNEARRSATFYAGDDTLKVTAGATPAVLTRAGVAATRIALVAPPVIDPRPAPTLMAPLSLLATAVGGTATWDPATRTARVTATIADAGYARATALLGSMPPYPGSTPSSAAMHGLPDGLPMAPYLRDVSGEWRAPAPLPAVAAWIGRTARRLGYVGGGAGRNTCSHGVCSETRYSGLFRLSDGSGFLPSIQVALGAVGRSATLVRYDALVADTPTRPAPDPVPAGADGVTVATVLGDGSLTNSRTVTDQAAVAALSALVDVLPLSTDSPINPGGPLITANTPTEVRLTFRYPSPDAHTVTVRDQILLPEPGLVSVSEPGETYPALSDPALALRRPPVDGPLQASFWSQLRSGPLFSLFPQQPGAGPCVIPAGGPPEQPPLRGRCATTLFDLSPGRQVVALSESWQGPGVCSAAWAFVLTPGGHILHATVVGAPPQSWQ